MAYQGVIQSVLRLAAIESVDYKQQTCSIRMMDRLENRTYTVPIPHGCVSTDSGVVFHPEKNTTVLVGMGHREKPFIVSTLPNASYTQDLTSSTFTNNIPSEFSGYPDLNQGEVALFGKKNTVLKLTDDGSIREEFGTSKYLLDHQDRILISTKDMSEVNESGYLFHGTIKRDLRKQSSSYEKKEEKLTSLDFERYLSEIARDPELSAVKVTSSLHTSQENLRNPPLIEKKEITYEYARQYSSSTIDDEIVFQEDDKDKTYLIQPDNRSNNRFDVLNLNVNNPNLLIEQVKGTLVDIYGNVLDLNRRVIDFPRSPDHKNIKQRLPFLNALLRRSIKYHFEINVKKDMMGTVATDILDGIEFKNGHTHSRWSMDVDNEGLTKINIPASSNIGNVPLLTRYVNDHLIEKTRSNQFKSDKKKDIFHLEFGDLEGTGINVSSSYAPQGINHGTVKYRTAFHDIITTANNVLKAPALSGSINNEIPVSGTNGSGNAGGRSVHANLDGSLELNIGRDAIDGKSIVVDTSGGIVARIGRTKDTAHAASIISQVDGNIYIQVGGDHLEPDQKIEDPEINVFVKGSKGTDQVIITSDFIKLKSASGGKSIILDSSKHIILKAAGTILLAGSTVGVHGSAQDDGENPTPKRLIMQDGVQI